MKRHSHLFSDLFKGWFSSHLLNEGSRGPVQFVDDLDHMDRDADSSGLIRDRTSDGLPDPPGSISTKLIAPLVFELFHRPHQPDISLLNEIQKLEPPI